MSEYSRYMSKQDIKTQIEALFREFIENHDIDKSSPLYKDIQELEEDSLIDIKYQAPQNYQNRLRMYQYKLQLLLNIHNHGKSGGGVAIYKGRKYKVHTGSRNGRYIVVGKEKKKVYI